MKKIIFTAALATGFLGTAQVYINGTSSTTSNTSNPSVIMEFQPNMNKGIVLPWTQGEVDAPANGTFILDAIERKVKVFSNDAWVDLSSGANTDNEIDMSLQSVPNSERSAAKVVIGAQTSAADGILVLEAADKALVLPQVTDPHLNIAEPAPGLMVYDPVKNLLCVYNGTQWSYWKAGN